MDIYTIPAEGGDETRLTTAAGLDDGPEYSPDGKYIAFASNRANRIFNLFITTVDGKVIQQITKLTKNTYSPRFVPKM